MPYRIHIDPSPGVAVVSFTGNTDADEMREARRAVVTDPAWRNEFHVIVDLSDLREHHVEGRDFLDLAQDAEEARRPEGRGRLAYIAEQDFDFGFLRMLRGQVEAFPRDVGLFRNKGLALKWLGIPPKEPPSDCRSSK